jgi:hypothetical protein
VMGMIFRHLLSCELLQMACASTSVKKDEGSSIGYDLGLRFHVYIGGMIRNLGAIAIYHECSWQHIMQ